MGTMDATRACMSLRRFCTTVLLLGYISFVVTGFQPSIPRGYRTCTDRTKTISDTNQRKKATLIIRMEDKEGSERSESLRKTLASLGEVSGSDDTLRVGSTVVAGNNIPNLGIWQFQSYELIRIYDQGTTEDGSVERISRRSLQDPVEPSAYKRYVQLYSEKHHPDGKAVIVSPDEVELNSMKQEVASSVLQALPLFAFWTALAFSFASQYSQRTGGTFVDAMLGR